MNYWRALSGALLIVVFDSTYAVSIIELGEEESSRKGYVNEFGDRVD